jgi:citronellol/citronellal dehydrogenase
MKLADKVAIVTGSSRGLGKAIALAFAEEGADVVVAARTETEMERLPGTINKTAEQIQAMGRRVLAVKCDVTSEEDVEAMVHRAIEEFGRIDVLVNNAGVLFFSPIVDTTVKRWDLIMRINLRGAFLCCKAVLPKMMEQKRGSIINMSSIAVSDRNPGEVPYAVTKAAIESLTFGLAEEVREYNIAVNALTPGRVRTEGAVFGFPPDMDWSGWSPPEVIGPPSVFLAAQDASSFTGKLVHTPEFGITWP